MRVMESVHAHKVTSMHCGGTIARIYEPQDTDELLRLIRELPEFHVLGGGTNTVFEDGTTFLPVIRLGTEFAQIERVPGGVLSGAAVSMKKLLSFCIQSGLAGIEFMAGIPGRLGGALFMNAGTPEYGILDRVTELTVADRTGVHTMHPPDMGHSYRNSTIPSGTIILAARMSLKPSTTAAVRDSVLTFIRKRSSQPRGYSSGSIFRNPPGSAAGSLIDQAGLKGLRVGGATVSEVHANFIINDRSATTADIKELIRLIKERVRERFGIELDEEVKIIGH